MRDPLPICFCLFWAGNPQQTLHPSTMDRCQGIFWATTFTELMKIKQVDLLADDLRAINDSDVSTNLVCDGLGNHGLPSSWRAIEQHSSRRSDPLGQAHAGKQRKEVTGDKCQAQPALAHFTVPVTTNTNSTSAIIPVTDMSLWWIRLSGKKVTLKWDIHLHFLFLMSKRLSLKSPI